MKILVYMLTIPIVLIFLSSCGTPVDRFSKISDLEAPFGISTDIPQNRPSKIKIFIDASSTMYGFTDKDGEFIQTINNIVSRLPLEIEVILYKFGENFEEVQGDLRNNLHAISRQSFYGLPYTDLCMPFELIKEDKNSVYLIITDGVQNSRDPLRRTASSLREPERTESPEYVEFARRLRDFLGEDGYVSLMGKIGTFKGHYWSVKTKRSIVFNPGPRPFYCLAFGNRIYSKFIRDYIQVAFGNNNFDFGIINPNTLRFDPKSQQEKKFTMYGEYKGRTVLPVVTYKLLDDRKELLIRLKDYHDSFGTVVDYRTMYKAPHDSLYRSYNENAGMVQARDLEDVHSIEINIPFKQNNPGNYLTRLTFRKTMPQWIREWSTDDDSKLENSYRTYKLEQWMQYILNSFGQDNESLSTTQYYIHVWRK